MRIVYIIILALSISACSSIKQSSLKWSVIYPNPKDSAIIQVKGLYANKGKLLYNNASESNVDKQEFEMSQREQNIVINFSSNRYGIKKIIIPPLALK